MKKAIMALVLIGIGTVILAEIAVRRIQPMDALVYQDSADPRLGFELRPGAEGMKLGVPVKISAQGLRDDLVASPKPADERRVVVVGGHETFGLGIDEKDSFVRLLAEGLLPPGAGRVRAVNLSMYSYSLPQKVELACTRLSGLEPEVVVLQATQDDLNPLPPPRVAAPKLKNWVRQTSALARWTAERRYMARAAAEMKPPVFETPAADSPIPAKIRAELQRFEGCVSAAGGKGVVMFVPSPTEDAKAAPTEPRRALESGAAALKLPFVDAGPALRRVPAEQRPLKPGSSFLSPAAHRAVAGELRRRLKPLLERRRTPAAARRPSV